MKTNKGVIGIGLVIAIVLGIVVVGGGAYYLGNSNSKKEVNNLPVKVEKSIDKNSQVINKLNSSVNVLSPNGGEVYKDGDKISIKWESIGKDKDNIFISLRFRDGGWCFIKDVPSSITGYEFNPAGHDCGSGRIINSGQYKVTLIAYENGGMAPEPGGAFAGDYSDNDGKGPGFSIDSSDNYFTINSLRYQNSSEFFSSNITCKDDPNYFIVSKRLPEQPGSDIIIKYKNSNKNIFCDYKVNEKDFEIKNNGNDQYYYGINKNLLILDSGTGPENRGIMIYNLDTRKKVYDSEYYAGGEGPNIILDTKHNIMEYWTIDFNIKPTAQNCPQYYKSGGGIASHILLDLSTLIKKETGEDKCVYLQ